ncbi:hypothetical protein DFH09DRAFT_1313418 [Mycena vulgaris]|nr:hypothetical protein DFH09DRAFT_1313418 [Mycena vulgaris]
MANWGEYLQFGFISTIFTLRPCSSAYLAGTGPSAANSPPFSSAGTSLQSLGYNTNTDSPQPATTIFYDPVVDYLGLTSDLGVFNDAFRNEDAYAVVTILYVDPQNTSLTPGP